MKKRRRRRPSAKNIQALHTKGIYEARTYGRLFDTEEDGAQEYVTRLLEGKHSHATVEQAFIDMARSLANPRSDNFQAQLGVHLALPTEPEKFRIAHRPFDVVNRRLLLEQLIAKLKPKQRRVILRFLEGYRYHEIAEEMHLTTARIQQIMKKSVDAMRNHLARPALK